MCNRLCAAHRRHLRQKDNRKAPAAPDRRRDSQPRSGRTDGETRNPHDGRTDNPRSHAHPGNTLLRPGQRLYPAHDSVVRMAWPARFRRRLHQGIPQTQGGAQGQIQDNRPSGTRHHRRHGHVLQPRHRHHREVAAQSDRGERPGRQYGHGDRGGLHGDRIPRQRTAENDQDHHPLREEQRVRLPLARSDRQAVGY